MADIKEKDNDGSKEAGSPKALNKKDKKKYHAFRSDDDDSSDQDEIDSSIAKSQKVKKDRSFKVKIKSIKGKKKEKEKKKKVKKGVDDIEDATVAREVIFGVPLELAVERSALPDKIPLPRIVRDCIQHIEETGLDTEGLYRVSGIKSKVDQMKQLYDEGKPVSFIDVDPCATSSLLKLYLRELPSSVLTTRLAPIFDSCVGLDDVKEQIKRFQQLINDLPCPNRTLLAWLFTHFGHVMQKHSANKMSIQNLTIVFSPTMSISHGVLNIFFEHTTEFFPDTELVRYIPPIKKEDSDDYPEDVTDLQEMLKQNEMTLTDLHDRVNQGCQDKAVMEELWERQRKSTQIKRKIKAKVQREKQNRESLIHEEDISNLNDKIEKGVESKDIQKEIQKFPSNQNLLCSKIDTNLEKTIKSNSNIELSENKREIVLHSNFESNKSSSQQLLHSNPDTASNSINMLSKTVEKSQNKSSSQQLLHSTVESNKSSSQLLLHSNLDSISNSSIQSKTLEKTSNKSSSQQMLHSSPNSIVNPTNIQPHVLERNPIKSSSQLDCGNKESELSKDIKNLKSPLQEQIDAEIRKLHLEERQLLFENEELLKIEELLHKKIELEKLEVETLKARIFEFENCKTSTSSSSCSSNDSLFNDDNTERIYNEADNKELEQSLNDIECKNRELELENNDMIEKIIEECNLCAKIMAKIRLLESEQ